MVRRREQSGASTAQSKALHIPPWAAGEKPPEQQHITAKGLLDRALGQRPHTPISLQELNVYIQTVPHCSSKCSLVLLCPTLPCSALHGDGCTLQELREIKKPCHGEGEDECTALAAHRKTSAVAVTHSFH